MFTKGQGIGDFLGSFFYSPRPDGSRVQRKVNPRSVAIPHIERIGQKYSLSWKNKERKSDNWKAKLYEQAVTGKQIGIYDRAVTVVRLENVIPEIVGVLPLSACPKGSSFNASFSRFKNGEGFCYEVVSLEAFDDLLRAYFGRDSDAFRDKDEFPPMKITQFFNEVLGAPLTNTQWSWGAESKMSRILYLRVWRDQISRDGGWVQVDWPGTQSPLGRKERARHLEMMKNGQPTFGVICDAIKLADGTYQRKIRDFDDRSFLRLGLPLDRDDDEVTWATVVERANFQALLAEDGTGASVAQDVEDINQRPIEATVKQALIDARLGQRRFRDDLLKLWGHRCSVTGSVTLEAVRASHILPWKDSDDSQRLDPYNGLPLNAGLDALFDRHLVSFDDRGRLLVSATIGKSECEILGLNGRKLVKAPAIRTAQYLAQHRKTFEALEQSRAKNGVG